MSKKNYEKKLKKEWLKKEEVRRFLTKVKLAEFLNSFRYFK